MLSLSARQLLGIDPHIDLPTDLATLFDEFFVGKRYETRFDSGWSFDQRQGFAQEEIEGFDPCLAHYTAPFNFALDERFSVYIDFNTKIASSFVSLVEKDAILVASKGTGEKRRGFGTLPSFEAFFEQHGEYISGWLEAPHFDPEFYRMFIGPSSVVSVSRFYSQEYLVCGLEYF